MKYIIIILSLLFMLCQSENPSSISNELLIPIVIENRSSGTTAKIIKVFANSQLATILWSEQKDSLLVIEHSILHAVISGHGNTTYKDTIANYDLYWRLP